LEYVIRECGDWGGGNIYTRNLIVICFGRNVWTGKELEKVIYELISKVREEEVIPHEWKYGIICPIRKKWDVIMCDYYREITMLYTSYKIVANIYMKT